MRVNLKVITQALLWHIKTLTNISRVAGTGVKNQEPLLQVWVYNTKPLHVLLLISPQQSFEDADTVSSKNVKACVGGDLYLKVYTSFHRPCTYLHRQYPTYSKKFNISHSHDSSASLTRNLFLDVFWIYMKQQVASLNGERKLQLVYWHSLKRLFVIQYNTSRLARKWIETNLIVHSLTVFSLLLLLNLFLIVFLNYFLEKCNSKETEDNPLGGGVCTLFYCLHFNKDTIKKPRLFY